MPLLPGVKNIGRNIKELISTGRPRKQAIAIAMKKAGKAKLPVKPMKVKKFKTKKISTRIKKRLRLPALGSLILLFSFSLAHAQTPCESASTLAVNPTKVAANLPDHETRLLDNSGFLVSGYLIEFFLEGASLPVTSVNINRNAFTQIQDSCYQTQLPSVPLAPNMRYVATMKALSSVGDSPRSDNSNPFGFQAPPARITVVRMVP